MICRAVFALGLAAVAGCASHSAAPAGAVRLDVAGYDASHPATLGLEAAPNAEHFTVYRPSDSEDFAYNHGAVLTVFQGRFYMHWQSSRRDEDAPETRVMYAISEDGETWSQPHSLAPARAGAVTTNGGWLTDGSTLVAFLNIWPVVEDAPRHGFTDFVES
ncbi:MAG: hypothetical protein WA989_11390, partial [Henriciella sp.]